MSTHVSATHDSKQPLKADHRAAETLTRGDESHYKKMAAHKRILRALGTGPTRRNLFGPVDREQLQREYRDALRKDLEDASRRWSFDFVAEKPLEGGDFRWVGVSSVRVPVLYRSCEDARNPGGSPGRENRFGSVPQDVEKTPEKRAEMKRKQTNITDFYQSKKRQVATPRKSGQ